MKQIIAIIPARSGSKSVIDKNIRLLNEKPMLAYSIEQAKKSKYINRIIVSTDSEHYAKIAREYGAEVPFLRPAEYATDTSLDLEVFQHALEFLKKEEGYDADIVVQLRPTHPIRNPKDIDNMIEILLENPEADSVRSMALAKEIPHKMWYLDEHHQAKPILTEIKEAYNMPRQSLPKVYYQNASIDCVRSDVILEKNSMTGDMVLGYEMQENFDIDTEEEFLRAAAYLRLKEGKSRFVFDIDGVIAKFRQGLDYELAEPNIEMINIVNWLYDRGNEIILFTARGYVTGIDWYPVTEKQMRLWNVKYHELRMGKPNADYYVDDKNMTLDFLYQEIGPLVNSNY